ncbi:HAD family hydrolase [Dietzia cinnamea]|uniref:HAD-IB family hydrolase n=2 Tax=Dietzia TaxID=37914 RepID=A0AAW5Q210_9ACTN|nr:HAD-IB family hydrolase [Dietzia cinnamea]MCT1863270.1 HAD-IB family hydrolase [Dietzia cinnamea]MCT2029631.1 HAD-IB family hydrolase [Dietzia cinnamea]MCT2031989.1 HAD-IB family hydrolase [Dietzia cinnamea]MCT2060270.1 HAD-IB family hydrolase [Dietzia cinnamea]MCT2075238.1 HAD-IB family hydrolase [Dietzia cinnamea]
MNDSHPENDHASDEHADSPRRRRLPGRADVISALGRLVWRRRDARVQRVAGEASAEHAVKLEPGAEPGPPLADADGAAAAPTAPPASDTAAEAAPDAEPFVADPRVAAFFDVDNTLIQGASIILLARGLAKHRFFTARDIAGLAWSQAKFRISGEENADDVAAGRDKALSFVKGRTVAELTALSEEVVDTSMLDRVWPGTRSLVQMHLDAGQQVWLVTATPVMLARVIATRLGLSGALGTVAEEHDGVYTGRLVGDILHGPGKAHAIAKLAEAEGFDLSRCYAYSDSFNDMPMLTMVGNPVAINPDSRLRKYASENGWDVKDFRTVRKAAKKAMPGVLAVGGLAGARAAARSSYGVRAAGSLRRMF